MANEQTIRTITIRGTSEGLDKLTADLHKLAAAEKDVAIVSDDLSKKHLSLASQLKAQTLKLDDAARAQNKYAAEQRLSQRGVDAGLRTQEQHNQVMALAAQRYTALAPAVTKANAATTDLTKQSSRNSAEMLNLGRQFADVAVSMQAGQSILVVGLQQGAQIIDVIASSNRSMGQIFGQATAWAGRFVTSTVGVVTGIAAIGAAAVYAGVSWQDGQREIDRALIGVGKRAGLTRDEINRMADTTAKSSRLSSSELRGTALELVKTGTIYGENIGKINSLVEGFALRTGQSAQEAGKALAEIFGGDIVHGADKLNAIYGNLSGRMRQYIVDLDSSGQRQKAIAVLADEMGKKTKESADAVGFWARSWQLLGQAASGAFDAMGKGMTNVTGIGETRLDALQTRLKFLQEGLKDQEQRSAGGGVGVDTARLERSRAAVKTLTDEIARLKKESGDISQLSVAEKIGLDADDAVRKLLPFIEQLDKVRKAQKQIAEAQATPGANQGLAQYDKQAADAGKVIELNLKAAADQQQRLNAHALELVRIEQESVRVGGAREGQVASTNIQVLTQLDTLQRQLPVAQAVGQMAQIEAQHRARIAELSITLNASEATRIANYERAVALAQIESQHRQTMVQLQGQLDVARQVTGIGQINAQYAATVASLELQIGLTRAIEQADMQRATAIAAVNTQAEQTLYKLQQQSQLIGVTSASERARIQGQHTYNDLIRQGVDIRLAERVAGQQVENEIRKIQEAERKAEEAAIAGIRTREDAWKAYTDGVISWSVANDEAGKANARNQEAAENAARSAAAAQLEARREMTRLNQEAKKFSGLLTDWHYQWVTLGETISDVFGMLQEGKDIWTKGGGISQFNPAGYESTSPYKAALLTGAVSRYGVGGFTESADPMTGAPIFTPNAQGLEKLVNASGGSMGSIISGLSSKDPSQLSATAGLLSRITNLLPEGEKPGAIQQQLEMLKGAPPSLTRDELIKQLNDQLKQLAEATKENTDATSAMTDVLSPFYSSDPRQTHLGFRAFARGGIMTEHGELPLRQYQGGGMATSPQVAVFGEGSTPEAYVPVPAGRIPVEIRTPANSNQRQRPVVVNINVMGNADSGTVAALRSTSFQQAQAMRRMMR